MLVKVIFHGVLKKLCPDEYKVEAETAAEAIRGVTNQLRKKLVRKDGTMFQVVCKQCLTRFAFFSHIPESEETFELDLYPAFIPSGGGNGNVVNMIVGAVLIVIGTLLLIFGPEKISGVKVATIGWSLITAGTIQFLTGAIGLLLTKKQDVSSDTTESSRTFGANTNTTKIGTRIPIGYGKYKIYGHYLSVNTQAVDRGV